MQEEEQEESPLVHHASARIAIEGSSLNEGGDVTLEISARGPYIGIVATQGEDDEEESLEMVLLHGDFLRFLTLAQALLSVAVDQEAER